MSVRAMNWAYGLFEVLDIPPAERAVLLALCWDHTDAKGCYPSQDRISLLSGYRRRHVNNLLKSLESMGMIKRHVTKTRGQFEKTNYQLFGVANRSSCAPKKAIHRVHPSAHGHRVHPGAQNRGSINSDRCETDFNVIEFPIQELKTSGGGDV